MSVIDDEYLEIANDYLIYCARKKEIAKEKSFDDLVKNVFY